jgi:hypothetical protein
VSSNAHAQRRGPHHHPPLTGPLSRKTPLSRPSAVGRDRTHRHTVFSPPPRGHRAGDLHRTRRPPARLVGAEGVVDLGRDSQAFTGNRMTTPPPLKRWPCPLYVACPRAESEGHADCRDGPRRISGRMASPCSRALLHISDPLSHVPLEGRHESVSAVVFGHRLSPRLAAPEWGMESMRCIHALLVQPTGARMHRRVTLTAARVNPSLAVPSGKVLRQGTTAPSGAIHVVCTHPALSQPSPASWWLALHLTGPLQGHAAHWAPSERPRGVPPIPSIRFMAHGSG